MKKRLKKEWISVLVGSTLAIGLTVGVVVAKAQENVSSIAIQADIGEYDQDGLPYGLEGCTYPVYTCTATDNLGNAVHDLETLVYYDVNGDTVRGIVADDVLVTTENGKFPTENVGQYVIEYTARRQALRQTLRLYVTVIGANEYLESKYMLNSDLVDNAFTGLEIELPDGQVSIDERFGNANVSTKIVYEGEHQAPLDSLEITQGVDRADFFTPRVAGKYTIVYTVENILGEQKSVSASHTITVTDDDKPVLTVPMNTHVLYVDEKVVFPVAEAIEYYNGEQVYVPVDILFNGEVVEADRSFTPTKAGKAVLSYVAKSIRGGAESRYDHSLTVHDKTAEIEDIFFSKYLYLENFTGRFFEKNKTYTDTDLSYKEDVYTVSASAGTERASVYFGRATNVNFLELKYAVEQKRFGFENLYVTFTDSKDASKSVEIRFVEVGTRTDKCVEVYVNGVYNNVLTNKCFSEYDKPSYNANFYLKYNPTDYTVIDEKDNLICSIASYQNGRAFDGFSSGEAYISVSIDGVQNESQLKLYSFATHIINANTTDKTKPSFVEDNRGIITADINTYVTIPYVRVFDALDDNIRLKIKLLDSANKMVFEEYITEDYTYLANAYGKFILVYTAYDSEGNSREKKTNIYIIDRIAPKIQAPEVKGVVEVGETYTFPVFKATDNLDEECSTWISVSYGNFQSDFLVEGKYKFEKAGTYTVKYNAIDSAGNYCVVSYVVVCK